MTDISVMTPSLLAEACSFQTRSSKFITIFERGENWPRNGIPNFSQSSETVNYRNHFVASWFFEQYNSKTSYF